MNIIPRFYENGVHSPLSNFYPSPIFIYDLTWPTVEHFYQAMKCDDKRMWEHILAQPTPGKAKKAGRGVNLRSDWESVKLLVMRAALVRKFTAADPILSGYLLNTGDALLVEGNTWGDTFWGEVDGKGQNWLGVLLMARRAELRAGL